MLKNNNRQYELDAARGLAVIFMVFVHVLIQFGTSDAQFESLYGKAVQALGGIPAAPVFMFLLGVGVIYSRRNTPARLVKRGLLLITAGYMLNLFRSVLPAWVNMKLGFEPYERISTLFYDNFFYIDILQFAGLTMLYFALSSHLKFSCKAHIFVLLAFMSINLLLSPYISYIENMGSSPVLALLFGNSMSFFPFFTWIAYPIGGYLFGKQLIQSEHKVHFYQTLFKVSFLLLIGYVMLIITFDFPTGYESDDRYYHHTLIVNLFYLAFILFWISCIYFLTLKLTGKLKTFLKSASALTTEIYFIHFLLIGLFTVLVHHQLGLWIIIPLSITIYMLSHSMAYLWVKRRKSNLKLNNSM
ncbi:heparan-alpha-glucosaminide N-acetyltransferase domain-containing protein [Paenibacillus sp. NPDC058174]|uniref:heparan-alpha-glucosaminide N-acetyltransferase domain-containing protein n=1 Tax=Paenibacillus sp. NPDC058174 TaxID=3346366 RepID=UPI0036D7BE1F